MKNGKRLLAVLLAFVLAASAVFAGGMTAFAEGEPTVHVSFEYIDEDWQEKLVAHVSVKNPEVEMISGAVFLEYDSMVLSFDKSDVSFRNGAASAGTFNSGLNGFAGAAWYFSTPVAASDSATEVAQLTFTIDGDLSDLTADSVKACTYTDFLNSCGGYGAYGSAVIGDSSDSYGTADSTLNLTFGAMPAAASAVTLNEESKELIIGETLQLEATVTPSNAVDKSVTWSSSDSNVASVSDTGLVTAKGEGTATITVTTASGGHTDTCAVTVKKPPVTITGPKNTQETVLTETGKAPTLPQKITVKYSDGSEGEVNVTWGSVDASSYAQAGSFTVNGTIEGYSEPIKCLVTVKDEVRITGIVGQYAVETTVNTAPVLPSKVEVSYSDGSKSQVDVTWDQVTAAQYASEGTFVVKGTVAGYDTKAECTVTVKAAPVVTITKIDKSSVTTKPGTAPTLPTKVKVTYSDNSTKELAVTWDSVAATQYASEGTFTVKGAVAGTDIKAECTVTVSDGKVGPNTGEFQTSLTVVIIFIAVSFCVTVYAAVLLRRTTISRARRSRR